MTPLSVWWRRNFGHRNDPPAMLPDPVRWTVTLDPAVSGRGVAEIISEHQGHGWSVAEFDRFPGEPIRILLTREDGAYRWRDDGFEGF